MAPARACAWTLAVSLVALIGCALPPQYVFEPKAQVIQVIATPDDSEVRARIIVSLLKIRRSKVDEDFELLGRMRVENSSDGTVMIPTERIVLLSGDLQEFGRPRLDMGTAPTVFPGANATVDLAFPLPVRFNSVSTGMGTDPYLSKTEPSPCRVQWAPP